VAVEQDRGHGSSQVAPVLNSSPSSAALIATPSVTCRSASPGARPCWRLRQHGTPAPEEDLSEFRVGLDHVSFGVADRAELEKWARRLDELGIAHGHIRDAGYGSALSFRDPDGIALELFAPPA
jgi:catechol 2,3-dioxygenase-like lactoylglutathione lyase family enzyme